ncbi:MAG: HlyD family type I secretion periplasmic adaptor subunit [Thiomicrorhabdus chilensis]|uniref:HlyD family type I secretion periplasmic adaptor subunit n=1 Tax=Thiomicrorhabdus chilensis TaxID=63656 RepID=UPI00299E3EC2|nr:HlyD family type I secretion periplasmic adaptor subunit [Thiomicrorhabdus chilensis]MDX1347429.1 HlyD family type I secretion periplasmic adaptor subunit [Thiomicrorhabdus chilensis]
MSQELTQTASSQLEESQGQKSLVKKDIESFKLEVQGALPNIVSDYRIYARFGLLVLFLVFVLFGGWAALAPLNSASVAIGEVMVVSNNRVVEHYEGGIVSEILVEEGDEVSEGQVLLRLSPTQAQSELSIVQSRLYEVLGLEARLKSERMLADRVEFPQSLLAQRGDPQVDEVIHGQQEVFSARKKALDGELRIYQQRVEALHEQISGLTSVIKTMDMRVDSYEREVADWEALYREQFADKIRLQEMQRELARLKGERGSHRSEIARLKVEIAETESQRILKTQQFREEVVSELRQAQSERVDLETRKVALVDRLQRIEITAPVDGRVNGLTVFTLGEVVQPGETLMEVVPNSKDYAVRARVATTDIDRVYAGLIADVRFSAFSSQTTHVIEGKVINVSADKFMDKQTGLEYFEAKVVLTPAGVEQMKEDGLFLLPGMPAEVMIKTGERTLLEYLLKPFENMFARSFNED